MKTLIVVLLFSVSFLYASNPTDIKTRYGTWLNVQIVDSNETTYIIKTSKGNRTVYKVAVLQIVYSPYDMTKESELIDVNMGYDKQLTENKYPTLKPEYEYPNLLMLPLTLVLGYMSYDYFQIVSDLQDQENDFKKLGIEVDYKSKKTRYAIGGAICLVVAITNTIFSLKAVKVTGSNNSIGLSYNF